MLLGPVFSVEVVSSARRARHYVLRVFYCVILLAALLICALPTFSATSGAVANATAGFFMAFAVLQVLAVLAFGPAMAAGAVATERERRTIEYLFASPLTNAEILLDKLAAKTLQLIGLLLAGLPVLSLAALLGGIAMEALIVVMAIATSTLLAVTMLSIALSAAAPRARDAIVRAYLLLAILLWTPLIVRHCPPLPNYLAWLDWLNDQLVAANPLWVLSYALAAASSQDAAAAIDMVWRMAGNQLIGASVVLAVAVFAVRRLHLKQTGRPSRRLFRFQLWRPRIGDRPMLWKELFAEAATVRLGFIGRTLVAIVFLGAIGADLYCLAQVAVGGPSRAWQEYAFSAMGIASVVGLVGALAGGVRGAVSVTSEKERGCWDGILTSPLGPAEIFFAKVLGCLYSLRGVAVLQVLLVAPVFMAPAEATWIVSVIWLCVSLAVCWLLASVASTLGV
ncbi:MAG: ABC transporter permease subunit, partial [Thermoguttaceae bacterium]